MHTYPPSAQPTRPQHDRAQAARHGLNAFERWRSARPLADNAQNAHAAKRDPAMINYVMVGTNRLDEAVAFFDTLLTEMGATRVYAGDRYAAWGWGVGTPLFLVTKPFNQEQATLGNGSMVAFDVDSPDAVDSLHAKVLALGGTSEGAPGPRGEHLYAAYWRDLDGNKFNFIYYRQKPSET